MNAPSADNHDPAWDRLRQEAEAIAQKESRLIGYLH